MSTFLRKLGSLAIAAAAMTAGPTCAAVALPPLNLGDSTFQDGIAGPGWLLQQTLSAYRADTSRDAEGHRIDASPDVASIALLMQASYLSERRVLGAWWGAEAIVPLVHARVKPAAGHSLQATGAGDVFISPMILQWPEMTLAGRPFWQRVNLNATLPTGDHGRSARLDLGSNAWLFNPHYAFTWEASPLWEISGRIHYFRSGKRRTPGSESKASTSRPGDAIHLNAAISRAVGRNLRLGASMYALTQIKDDRVDGQRLTGRERVLAFGPSFSWKRGNASIHATAHIETLAKDRTEGTRLSLRYATAF